MATTNQAPTYEQAISAAYASYASFYDMHESIDAMIERGGVDPDLLDALKRDEQMRAAVSCAQQDMVRWLFGKSEEEVHSDLELLYREEKKSAAERSAA